MSAASMASIAHKEGIRRKRVLTNHHVHQLRQLSYLLAFFATAQRRLTASCIRARPSGDKFRFFFLAGAGAAVDLGRPGFFLSVRTTVPDNKARACWSLAISASRRERISVVFMSTVYSVNYPSYGECPVGMLLKESYWRVIGAMRLACLGSLTPFMNLNLMAVAIRRRVQAWAAA